MRVILFGATGMVGQELLRECLLDSEIINILAIGRSALGHTGEKMREIVRKDHLTTTEDLGRAMIEVAKHGAQ